MSLKRMVWSGVLAMGISLGLGGCGLKEEPLTAYDAQYLLYFDTFSTLTVYADSEEQFEGYKDLADQELKRYHQLFDIYNSYDGVNNIKTINDSAGIAPVEVEQPIIDLLGFCKEMYEETDGKCNVAMGSVLSIWHDYRDEALKDSARAAVPGMEELQKAAEHMDISKVVIDEEASTVYLEDPDMRLDVGAVAKGFAARELAETLKEAGAAHALISLGGNVASIGTKGDGTPWRVGIQNPDWTSDARYLHVADLEDMSLVTSGDYQRFYEVDGVRYHHIINPDTLMPWNEYRSVTILCPDSGRADALSTAVFNMELADGQALIESLDDTEALWVLADGTEVESSGFGEFEEP